MSKKFPHEVEVASYWSEDAIEMLPVSQERHERFLVRAEQGKDLRGHATFDNLSQVVSCAGATLERYPYAKVTIRRYRA
jgi:hypothetical protein